ncbi:MAG: WD40 repeat domain-containing protein, partial [Candidatus Solibacter sp.]|nr:WD40 repeat domain-containing protein [Candidatus Solibacter sp.]
ARGLIPAYRPNLVIREPNQGTLAMTFGPAGKLLLSAGADGTVRIWHSCSQRLCRSHSGQTGPIWSVAFERQGGTYAWGSNDGTVRVASLSSAGSAVSVAKPCDGPVLSLAFAPSGNIMAAGGCGGGVWLYDWNERRLLDTLATNDLVVHCIRFSPDGKWLAAAAGTRVWLWNFGARDKTPIELSGHRKSVLSLAFSPDGALLASAGRDAAIRIWDARDGFAFQRQLSAHLNSVWALDFSAVPRLLASGGADGAIRIWNPQTGETGEALETEHGCVQAISFNPKSLMLASAGADGGVVLWEPARERSAKEART